MIVSKSHFSQDVLEKNKTNIYGSISSWWLIDCLFFTLNIFNTMLFKKCKFKKAMEADRYVRGQMSDAEKSNYEQLLKKSVALQREVRFARQLMIYYQKPNDVHLR